MKEKLKEAMEILSKIDTSGKEITIKIWMNETPPKMWVDVK